MNDFETNIKNIRLSISKVRQYEYEEKSKDINYHINKLPNELIKYIYFYLSLCPFDKEEFKKYHKKKVLFYTIYTPTITYSPHNRVGYEYHSFYTKQLLGYGKDKPKTQHGYDLRIMDNPNEYDYYSRKQRKNKKTKTRYELYKNKKRLLWFLQNVYFSKEFYKAQIKMISNEDIKKLVSETQGLSTSFKSRFKVEDYKKIFKMYYYKYY